MTKLIMFIGTFVLCWLVLATLVVVGHALWLCAAAANDGTFLLGSALCIGFVLVSVAVSEGQSNGIH